MKTDALLSALSARGVRITLDELRALVASSDKQRFALDEVRGLIRANQGHSVEVDLLLEPAIPPEILYHGTAERYLAAILVDGLQRMKRHHVHLSRDEETAHRVGSRCGRAVVLRVNARHMHHDGFVFLLSDNGVWLTDQVPPHYLGVSDRRSD